MEEHHAITCNMRHSWRQTYISKDKDGKPQAFEFKCTGHAVNFWLAVPTPEILALQD